MNELQEMKKAIIGKVVFHSREHDEMKEMVLESKPGRNRDRLHALKDKQYLALAVAIDLLQELDRLFPDIEAAN